MLRMKGRERMGTSLRTMVKAKMTTKVWEKGSMATRARTGVRDRMVTTCAVMVHSPV